MHIYFPNQHQIMTFDIGICSRRAVMQCLSQLDTVPGTCLYKLEP